jgi:hypothetical protein
MAEASLKLGGSWATKEGSLLGFNDQNGNYKPIPFDFTRATTATRVNRNGLIEEAQSGVPRIDFTGDGSLLLEPQRTNLLTYSEDFTSWTKLNGGTGILPVVTSNQTISPDGTQNADKIVFNKGAATSNSDYSLLRLDYGGVDIDGFASIYLKADSNVDIEISPDDVNYQTVSVTTEWQRFSVNDATSDRLSMGLRGTAPITTSATIYAWGAQLEQGSYATSYIKTSGSAVTRNVDFCQKTGFQGVSMNATQGTILMHIDNPYALGGNNDFHMFRASGSSGINDGWLFRCNSGTTIDLLERVGGSTGAQVSSLATKDQINKIAWSFNASTFLISANGVTKSYTGTYNGTQIDIDEFNTSGLNLQGLEIINMQFFETALTQDELNALTTL